MSGRGRKSSSSLFLGLSPCVFPISTSKFGLTAVPQPTCHANHLPPYLEKYEEFKAKGVDVIAVVAANDPYVMSGWGRFEGLDDKVRKALYSSATLPIICRSLTVAFFRS